MTTDADPIRERTSGHLGTRWDFLGIAAWILYHLDREQKVIETIPDHGPEFGYIDWSQLAPETQRLLDEKGAA